MIYSIGAAIPERTTRLATTTACPRGGGGRQPELNLAGFAGARIKDLILRYELKPGQRVAHGPGGMPGT